MKDIIQIAKKLTIKKEQLILYGNHKAKINIGALDASEIKKSKLILVTSITPTKAGNGKTTTSIGLADGLNRVGKNAILALREPSLGPCNRCRKITTHSV